MIVPAFSQGLYGRLRQLAAADWQRYVAHPFVQQLADGTLAENAFRRYLTQDYLFLIMGEEQMIQQMPSANEIISAGGRLLR